MKFFFTYLLAVCVLAVQPSARAFLDDDFAAIESHYGAALVRHPLAPGLEVTVHETTGYRVLVLYRNGHSSRETFSKLADPLDLTDAETAAFLKAHADGQRWDKLAATNRIQVWERPGALATYLNDGEKPGLSFESLGPVAALAGSAPGPETANANEKGLTTGKLSLGTVGTGKIATGKLQFGGLSTGNLAIGQLQTGKLSIGKLEGAGSAVGPAASPANPPAVTPAPDGKSF